MKPNGQLYEVENALFITTSHFELGNSGRRTGCHLGELVHTYYILKQHGFQVDFASPQGGEIPIDPNSSRADDALVKKFCKEEKIIQELNHSTKLEDIDPNKYSVAYFPGGHGCAWDLPGNLQVARIVGEIYNKGGIIAAICHGPAALVDLKVDHDKYLVEGKRVNCLTNAEEMELGMHETVPFLLESKLIEQGAIFVSTSMWYPCVVEDQRIITGQNPASAKELGLKIIAIFESTKNLLIKI